MIFNFTQALPVFTAHSRSIFDWLSRIHDFLRTVRSEQDQQTPPVESSMYSLLISNDAARGRLF